MAETVYVSAGSARYHRTPDCRALESMRLLNEDMGGYDWVPGAPYTVCHAFLPVAIERAAKDGKTPCSSCKPPLAAADSFGHEPTWINAGYCGGCDRCGDLEEREVCARCVRLIPTTPGPWPRESVPWPCTSAVVLGLTPREVTA